MLLGVGTNDNQDCHGGAERALRAMATRARIVGVMPRVDLGTWVPLDVEAVAIGFAAASFRWWVGGGLALELHLGRSWRQHGDTDVGIVRSDAGALHALLSGWDLHIAADGRLTPWRGQPLDPALHQNNVWCRAVPDGPWVLDVTVGGGSPMSWVYRRDPSVEVAWDDAVLRSADGIPYLAPELQLLFKSKDPRPKDHLDAAQVIPELDTDRRQRLGRLLPDEHPWKRLVV